MAVGLRVSSKSQSVPIQDTRVEAKKVTVGLLGLSSKLLLSPLVPRIILPYIIPF